MSRELIAASHCLFLLFSLCLVAQLLTVVTHAQSWDLFAFNYDASSQAAQKQSLPVFSGSGLVITCDSCYAYLDAGFVFELVIEGVSSPPFVLPMALKVTLICT